MKLREGHPPMIWEECGRLTCKVICFHVTLEKVFLHQLAIWSTIIFRYILLIFDVPIDCVYKI